MMGNYIDINQIANMSICLFKLLALGVLWGFAFAYVITCVFRFLDKKRSDNIQKKWDDQNKQILEQQKKLMEEYGSDMRVLKTGSASRSFYYFAAKEKVFINDKIYDCKDIKRHFTKDVPYTIEYNEHDRIEVHEYQRSHLFIVVNNEEIDFGSDGYWHYDLKDLLTELEMKYNPPKPREPIVYDEEDELAMSAAMELLDHEIEMAQMAEMSDYWVDEY